MGSYVSMTRPADFRAVLAEGSRRGGRGVTVYVRPTDSDDLRVGLVVRTSTAVARNRVKRRLRAAVRAAAPAGGRDVVIRADERAAGKDFQEMVATIDGALRAGAGI